VARYRTANPQEKKKTVMTRADTNLALIVRIFGYQACPYVIYDP